MKEGLKPCPFCGETCYLQMNTKSDGGEDRYYISCEAGCCKQNYSYGTPNMAIMAWNERLGLEYKKSNLIIKNLEDCETLFELFKYCESIGVSLLILTDEIKELYKVRFMSEQGVNTFFMNVKGVDEKSVVAQFKYNLQMFQMYNSLL